MNNTTTSEPLYANCSIDDPCGSNGYCRIENDQTVCDCKFWWSGERCDQWTSSGKQVIILAGLVALLILAFYGSLLARCISKKFKSIKDPEKKDAPPTKDLSKYQTPSASKISEQHIYTIITGVASVLLGFGALAIKWSILKPVHDELVEKFRMSLPLRSKRPVMCNKMNFGTEFKLITFPISVALVFLFAILSKRTAIRHRHWCRGYFAMPIPLDFFAHIKRTFSAVIFALYADELLDIASELIGGSSGGGDGGIMIVYLMQIFKVILIGFRCYPTLVAVYLEHILALICGSLYAWLDFGVTIYYNSLCRNIYYPIVEEDVSMIDSERTMERYFKYYGTGTKILLLQLIVDAPRYLCLAYVSIKLPMLLVKRIRQRNKKTLFATREQRMLLSASSRNSVETLYVKNLLGYGNPHESKYRFLNYFRWLYGWRDDFRFSARVLSVYSSVFLALYFVNMQAIIRIIPRLEELRPQIEEMIKNALQTLNLILPFLTGNYENETIPVRVPQFVRPFLIGMILSSILTTTQLLVMLASIRRNLLQACRGDDSEIPRRVAADNTAYAAGSFHFGGYFIGFLLWGYIVVLIFAMFIAILIDLWIAYGKLRVIEVLLKFTIPAVLFVVFKMYLNKFFAQYVFLQGYGDYLSINNRRFFMVFIYFNFFLDAFLGLVASISRVLKSMIAGLLYMSRLDYSPLGRKLETFDVGFSAYCGFIHVECAHRHPIMLCFASHLLRQYLEENEGLRQRLSRAKRRWHLAAFLINNPTFVYRRKAFLEQFRIHETRIQLDGQHNVTAFYIEQPSPATRRVSIISENDLRDLWQKQRF